VTSREQHRVAVIGTVGVPGNYGGFETLAENLVSYHGAKALSARLTVYCSAKSYPERQSHYGSAELRYVPLSANGIQSVLFDIVSLVWALRRRETHLLILGVSGCVFLPLLRRLTSARVLCNIDGIEWRRSKWRGLAKWFLRLSEELAVRNSDVVIADNKVIADYVAETYGRDCAVIAYGGDHALVADSDHGTRAGLPENYALALCRIEPENNVSMILDAWTSLDTPLVFVGNWDRSEYGKELKRRYGGHRQITLLDPIYEPAALRAIRDGASIYVHGHSAGGTNPSLVEMMHFGVPVLAYGCDFNRETTERAAWYFTSVQELVEAVVRLDDVAATRMGSAMKEVATRRYRWDSVGADYFALLGVPLTCAAAPRA
jgi:glycosyltransferase involved in cell wall biosynthesis